MKIPVTIPGPLPHSGATTRFETGAQRDAYKGKGFPSMIPPQAIRRLAMRFEEGADKYNRNNWLKGIPLSRFLDAIQRHLQAMSEGLTDEDHAAAVMWNTVAFMETLTRIEDGRLPVELDDRIYIAHGNPEKLS